MPDRIPPFHPVVLVDPDEDDLSEPDPPHALDPPAAEEQRELVWGHGDVLARLAHELEVLDDRPVRPVLEVGDEDPPGGRSGLEGLRVRVLGRPERDGGQVAVGEEEREYR